MLDLIHLQYFFHFFFWPVFFLFFTYYIFYTIKQLWRIFATDRVVFVSSRLAKIRQPLDQILDKYIKDTTKLNFVELGAGHANVARHLAKLHNWKSVTAVEIDWWILLWPRIRNYFEKLPLKFVKSDVFSYKVPKNSLVYCYMTTKLTTKMYELGMFDGNVVVSLTFKIKGIEPDESWDVPGFQKRIMVYDFRKNSSRKVTKDQ